MKKIVILGCPGSGKTTLAIKLGQAFDIPVHHLDKIFWTDGGHLKQDPFIAHQIEMMASDTWIIDGGFERSKSYDLRLSNADTIIFFAFNKSVIYWRLLKRAIEYYNKLRPDMGGNRKNHFNWALVKYIWDYPTKQEYGRVLEQSNAKKVVILNNPKEEKAFLGKIKSQVYF